MRRSMMDLAERVYDWLPARADRRRVTVPSVIAVNLDAPVAEVMAVLMELIPIGCVFEGRRGSYHRGVELPWRQPRDPPETTQEALC